MCYNFKIIKVNKLHKQFKKYFCCMVLVINDK